MKVFQYQSHTHNRNSFSQELGSNTKRNIHQGMVAVMLLFSLLLTACGGGGGSAPPADSSTVTVLALGSLPLSGQALDANANRLIEVTGLTAGTIYTFTITATDTGIAVFEDAALTRQLCGTTSRTRASSCLGESAGASVFIDVQEFSGSADSFELNVVQTPSSVTPLGSPLTDQTLSPAGIALIEVTGLTPGTFYTFSMAAANDLNIVIFDNANFNGFLCSSSTSSLSSVASCATRSTGTSLFVQIRDFSASGGSFDFNVVPTPLTVLSPADLPLANQTLSAGEIILYDIGGLTFDTTYTVSAVGTNTKEMGVFNNESESFPFCESSSFTGVTSCAANSGTTLFVQLRNSSSADESYSFNLVPTPVTSVPFVTGGLSLSGQTVSADENALFEISGLTDGAFYNVSIADTTNNLDLQVHGDASFNFQLCSAVSDAALDICQPKPFGTSFFVRVIDSSGLGDSFDLNVVQTPVTQVALGDLPLPNPTLPARLNQVILFEITGLTAGSFYNISTASTTGSNDAQPTVYDNGFSDDFSLCSSISTDGMAGCTARTSTTSLFVQVNIFSGSGDVFELNATEVPVSLLALGDLPLASQTLPANGSALYEISGLNAGTLYTVSATGSNDKVLGVFDQRTDQFGLCFSGFSDSRTEACAATPGGTSLFIRVDDESGLGDSFELNVAAIPVTPLALGDPALTNQVLPVDGTALFEISGLTAGVFYTVTATGSSSKQLAVINESDRVACSAFSRTGTSSCAAASDGTSLFVRVDDASGLGDSFEFSVATVPVTSLALNDLPLANQTLSPNGTTLFEITGLTPDTPYTVSTSGTNGESLEVFTDSAFTLSLCGSFSGSGLERCDITPTSSSLFVKVDESFGLGDTFELSVVETPVTPVALGGLPLAGQALPERGVRLYQVSGLTAGTFYAVSATGTNSKALLVLNEDANGDFLCSSSFSGTGFESCPARPAGTSMFVSVSDSGLGDSFELNVVEIPVTPVALTSVPLVNQTLSANGLLQYQITGLTAGTFYTFSVTGTNTKELRVIDDSNANNVLCVSFGTTGSASCAARRTAGTSLVVRVRDFSGQGDSFEINVVETPVTPVALTSVPLVNQTLSVNGLLQYQITGLTAGTFYDVSVTGINNKQLLVFDNRTDEFTLCGSATNAGPESCAAAPTGASLFITVRNSASQSDSFELNLVEIPVTQVALGDLPLPNQTLSANGLLQYQITGLTAATLYTISITGSNVKELLVFDNSATGFPLCVSSISGNGPESCEATPTGTSLIITVRDFSALGDSFEFNVTTVF